MWRRFHPRQEQKQKGSMNLLNMPQLILDSCALCCHCPSPGCPIWRGFHQPRLQQKQRVAWTCWTFPSWSWTAVLSLPESRVGREGHKRRREGGLLEASSKKRVGGLLGVLAKRGRGGRWVQKSDGEATISFPSPLLGRSPPLSAFEEVWHPSIGEICKHHESVSKKLLHGRFQISNAATQWEQQGYSVRLAKTLEVSGCHQSLPPWRLLSVCFPAPWQWHILKLWQLGAGTSNIHRTNFDVGWHSIGTTVQPNENNWQCLRSSSSASLSTWSPSIHGMASAGKLSPASGFMALQMGNHRLEPD